jgi:hypothetical protein
VHQSDRAHGRRRRRRRGAVVWVLFLASPGIGDRLASGAGLDPDLSAYREIVHRYRSGAVAEAVASVTSWPGERLVRTARRLRSRDPAVKQIDPWDIAELDAASLLHLEVAVAHPGQRGTEALHLQIVREDLRTLRRLDPFSPLTADLHLALALYLQGQLRLEDLESFFGEIGTTLASHGRLLLAQATLHEVLASRRLAPARSARLAPGAEESLETAERVLREALAAAPRLSEARLRLGHVVVQRGRIDEGLALLHTARQESEEPTDRYFAELFTGQAQVLAGRTDLAERAFEAALAECPCGQAAAVARAHLAFRERRYDEVRDLVAAALRPADGCDDPWAFYDYGQANRLGELIGALRRDVGP